MRLILIAALSVERCIGSKDGMLWHCPEDLRHFKKTTDGHVVIMGGNTYRTLGEPLSNRVNIVVSRTLDQDTEIPNLHIVRSVWDAIELAMSISDGNDPVYVIGGGEIYKQTINHAHELLISHMATSVSGDVFFPEIDRNVFRIANAVNYHRDAKVPFVVISYTR